MVAIAMMAILFGAGILFLVGPTALSYILTGFAAVEPVSGYVTAYLAGAFLLYIFLNRMHRRTFRRPRPQDPKEQRKLRNRRARLVKMMTVIQWIAMMSIVLIAFHGLFVKANSGWMTILSENEELFSTLRYVGIVLIAVSVGFRIGIGVSNSRKKNNSDDHTETDQTADVVVTQEEIPSYEPEVVDYSCTPFTKRKREVNDEDLEIHLPGDAVERLG